MDMKDAWDKWWQTSISEGDAAFFPVHPAPLGNGDGLLVGVMAEYGLRTVLCAGNGVSQEPRALANAGCTVTALDISAVATRCAETPPEELKRKYASAFWDQPVLRPGGSVEFVVGDLLDAAVCPGPFDVVIERRTVQVLEEQERAKALSALGKRLSKVGILLSLCLDDPFPMELGWSQHPSGLFHASESWFREQNWAIWDGAPSFPLTGRVAWLIRCGSMKPPPGRSRRP